MGNGTLFQNRGSAVTINEPRSRVTACAKAHYLSGLEQPGHWHTGLEPSLSSTSRGDAWRVILRSGHGFNALRDGREGAHSVGVLCQYDFEQRKHRKQKFK